MIKKRKGLTLVEVMVVIGVIAIIFWGLMKFFSKSTDIWFFGKGQLDMQDKAREALYWIGQDFRNAKTGTMGNLIYYSDFEEPMQFNLSPYGWDGISPNGNVRRIGPSGPMIRSGFRSMELSKGATAYFSNTYTIPETKSYIISGWSKSENLASEIKLVKGDGTDFLPVISLPNSNYYWVHLTTASVLPIGQTVKMKLVHPGESWGIAYQTNLTHVYSLCEYNGKLYAGAGGNIYVYDGTSWSVSFGPLTETAYSLCTYNNKLYAATGNNGRIYVYDGTSWNLAYDSPEIDLYCLYVYNNKLYAGTGNNSYIYVYDGTSWSFLYNCPGDVDPNADHVYAMCVYNNKLYVGTGHLDRIGGGAVQGEIFEYNGTSWTVPYDPIQSIYSLCVYNNKLYAGDSAGQVYCYDGTSWSIIQNFGAWNSIFALYVHNNKLYVAVTCPGINQSIQAYDGFNWQSTGSFSHWDCNGIWSLGEYNYRLYFGGRWGLLPVMARVYIYNEATYFDDVSVSPVNVTFDTTSTNNIYEYYTAYTTGTITGTQFKKYRLRYEVKNPPNPAAPGALYRERWIGPNPGDYEKVGILPSGTLCENVKSFKIADQNQETFEVELVLEKEISAGKKKEYRLKNTFTPLVP